MSLALPTVDKGAGKGTEWISTQWPGRDRTQAVHSDYPSSIRKPTSVCLRHIAGGQDRKPVLGRLKTLSENGEIERNIHRDRLTGYSRFLFGVQNALVVYALGEVILGLLAELKVFHGYLSDELEILLKLIPRFEMVVVKFHPGYVRVLRRADSEGRHSPPVHVQSAVREEVEEQSVIRLLGICNVLGEIPMVVDSVERWRVVDRE